MTDGINYASNSHKSKEAAKVDETEARPKMEKVIAGTAVQRKKPLGRRVKEMFAGDDAQSVGNYILVDVVVPAIKNTLSDAVSQGVERMLFGTTTPRSNTRRMGQSGGGAGYTTYNRTSTSRSQDDYTPGRNRVVSTRVTAQHDFREIVLDSRGEVELVIDRLFARIDKYGSATVGDLFDLTDISGDFTQEKYGWYKGDLDGAHAQPVRGGYLIILPDPVELDR